MVVEENENDGCDLVGSFFKVYPKPKPARKHMFWYNSKLVVPPCEPAEALTELSKVLVSIWTAIREADKKLVIYLWKDGSTYAPLQKIKDMPTKFRILRGTSTGRSPRKQEGRHTLAYTWDTTRHLRLTMKKKPGGLSKVDTFGTWRRYNANDQSALAGYFIQHLTWIESNWPKKSKESSELK